jgi:signal transduction histidine kinase
MTAIDDHVRAIDARLHAQLRQPRTVVLVAVASLVLCVLGPRAGWTAGLPPAVVTGSGIAFAASFVASFLAFRVGGVQSRAYAVADGIEAIVYCTFSSCFVLFVPTPHNFGWLMHFMFVLHAGQSPLRRPLYEVLYVAVPAVAVAGHALRADWSLAAISLVFGGVLIRVRHTLLHTATETTENLARRVALEEALRSAQLAAERARIARDLHDGVSSELHALIWLLEQKGAVVSGEGPDLSTRLRATASEVRDLVWGLSVTEKPWQEWVGDMRARCRELCGSTLKLEFVSEGESEGVVSARTQHALTHILLEATRNAARHSGGSQLRIQLTRDATHVFVEVRDDGRGIPDESARSSPRGLNNLRVRAAEIGGRVEITDARPGACVSVALPTSAAPAAPGSAAVRDSAA